MNVVYVNVPRPRLPPALIPSCDLGGLAFSSKLIDHNKLTVRSEPVEVDYHTSYRIYIIHYNAYHRGEKIC